MGKGTNSEETIAAISTPLGEGGIGIVRISGPASYAVLSKAFRPLSKTSRLESHRLYLGIISHPNGGKAIDQALAAFMKAPKSYTGEDVVEISCHGGVAVLKKVLEAALASGARLALPGEFTKRAFLNGRLDLAQAEAVIDLIKAKSPECAAAASGQLLGELSAKITSLRRKLLAQLAAIEASIDFPDDVKENREGARGKVRGMRDEVEELLKTSDAGMMMRQGVPTAILGKPNVGKSSLLNALLKFDRAIVSPEPGTTRDTIEEAVNIKGIPLNIIDTAGMRKAKTPVEKAGVERAKGAASKARILIIVIDASSPLDHDDDIVLGLAKGRQAVVVLNKSDKKERVKPFDIKKKLADTPIFRASALYGSGIDALEKGLYGLLTSGAKLEEDTIILNLRHKNCLIRAREAMMRAEDAFASRLPEDLAAADLKEAAAALGEITGEAVSGEIIDLIFSEFCIGK